MFERKRWLSLLMALAVVGCGPLELPGAAKDEPAEESQSGSAVRPDAEGAPVPSGWQCADWAEVRAGDLILVNNVWNKQDRQGYEQCVAMDGEQGVFSMRWKWPERSAVPASYPSIVYGWEPWRDASTTDRLPRRVSELVSLAADYRADIRASGLYNLAFDIWLVTSATPSPDALSAEVMIWLDQRGLRPPGDPQEQIRIAGRSFTLYTAEAEYVDRGATRRWPIFSFVSDAPRPSGRLPLDEFLGHLVGTGRISSDAYVASVELGSEIAEGAGRATLTQVSIRAR